MPTLANTQLGNTFNHFRISHNVLANWYSRATSGSWTNNDVVNFAAKNFVSNSATLNYLTANISVSFGAQANVTVSNVNKLMVKGGGSNSQVLYLVNSTTGQMGFTDAAASFSELSGQIANNQFPSTLSIGSNTTFANGVTFVGNVKINAVSGLRVLGGSNNQTLMVSDSTTGQMALTTITFPVISGTIASAQFPSTLTVPSLTTFSDNITFSANATFANVDNVHIPGTGASNGQVLSLVNSTTGEIGYVDSAASPSFDIVTGVIANTQFPNSLGLAANVTFTGSNVVFNSPQLNIPIGSLRLVGLQGAHYLRANGNGVLTSVSSAVPDGSITSAKFASNSIPTAAYASNSIPTTALNVGANFLGNTTFLDTLQYTRGYPQTSANFNSVETPGFYHCSSMTNGPALGDNFNVQVIVDSDPSNGTTFTSQIAAVTSPPEFAGRIYTRQKKTDNSWTSWLDITAATRHTLSGNNNIFFNYPEERTSITIWDNPKTVSSVDTGNNSLEFADSHEFRFGDVVYITSSGSVPTGLSNSTKYYVRDIHGTGSKKLKLTTSYGGSAVGMSGAGSGTIQLYRPVSAMTPGPFSIEGGGSITVPNGSTFVRGGDLINRVDTTEIRTGYTANTYDNGIKSSGTLTADPTLGNFQRVVANGAFTLSPPSSVCTMIFEWTNGSSAGSITTSGFTLVNGDDFTTTNGDDFVVTIVKTENFSQLNITALQ